MGEVDLEKIYEGIEFLKDQVMEMRSEIDELVGGHELNPEYEEKLKRLLEEDGTRFKSIEEFEAAFE
jgi:predicted component of type VI protein secretion system